MPNLENYCLSDTHLRGHFSKRDQAVCRPNESNLIVCKASVIWSYSSNEWGYSFGDAFWRLFSSFIDKRCGNRGRDGGPPFSSLGQCRDVLWTLLFSKQPSTTFCNTLGGSLPSKSSFGHFFSRLLGWNESGRSISSDCHVGKFRAYGQVVCNPSLFSFLPVATPRLNYRGNRPKPESYQATYPVGLMGYRIFRRRYVGAQSPCNVKRPSYIANGIRSRVGQRVNVPSAVGHVVLNASSKVNYTSLCGHAGEHDALLEHGWHLRTWKAGGGYALREEAIANAKSETLWCSPHCVPARGAAFNDGLFAGVVNG